MNIMPAAAAAAVREAVNGLTQKNNVRENILQIPGDYRETFKIRVESPQVLVLKIQKSGEINFSLVRTSAFIAHVEGTVSHIVSTEEVVYQRPYRSDKGGYQVSLDVKNGDVLSVGMEAHHFCSAVVGQGSSEMEIKLSYSS